MKYKPALTIAESWLEKFQPFIVKGSLAGSLRRRCDDITDIDLVVEPKLDLIPPMFMDEPPQILNDYLYNALTQMSAIKEFEPLKGLKPGFRNCKLMLPQGLKLDLSAVRHPAQWGVIFLLRTGPADFSKWMVTDMRAGGVLPHELIFEGGAIGHATWQRQEVKGGIDAGQIRTVRTRADVIPTPDEESIFKLCGLNYIDPPDRQAHWDRWRR